MSIAVEAAAECVQLVPNPAERGGKLIVVVDETWGRVEMRQHGGAGASYIFFDAYGKPVGKNSDRTGRVIPHVVYGDKMQSRRERGNAPIAPIAERLVEAVRYMIRAAMLRSPSDLQAAAAADREAFEATYAAAVAAEQAEFEAKADEIVKDIPTSTYPFKSLRDAERLRDQIVAAMRWAQTK